MKKIKLKYFAEDFDSSVINLTPLIDVLFVILVTFILIAPLVKSDQIDLAQASISQNHTPKASCIAIHVKKDNSLWIEGRRAKDSKELIDYLIQKRKLFPKEVPQVFHDQKATFGTYQMVKDCLERAGFKEMEIILQPN